ncbi:MAG: Asp-tRNA(Asn)/Glu-tRNA(Gln) amidotransferase subunit GatB [Oscillospiraceae bacterium]|nr:Asp-tRNA(Asn)/Glu-tRNA(Gln) amidotransferase subunit GatB [Oscillospiraceae bacterium]
MKWEVVMGLEVHAELSTNSKIFCGCSTEFGAEPNRAVCPVCSGMPGTLPKLNRAVVEYAVRLGMALDCEINSCSEFDRKNYFYPDLPKAYQVSQLYAPICRNGYIDIDTKRICIREIHMEEDAGKLIHSATGETKMDFNRCGVPLLEIVTQPDFRTADEVIAYLEKLREILLYLDICDCKMQEGSMRVDVNLSVSHAGAELGTRTEMKNLNSFKAIKRAIEYESARQISVLEKGGFIVQETRRWDDEQGESYGMRSKENAQDYRYFPEPDLPPIVIDDEWLRQVRDSLPELAHQKRERYIRDYGLSEGDAAILTSHSNISQLLEKIVQFSCSPRETANLITGSLMRLMNATNKLPEDLNINAEKVAVLVQKVSNGEINRNVCNDVLEAVFTHDVEPQAYIDEKGLAMVNDENVVVEAVITVLAENASAVSDYSAGKEKAFGFLMGQVMRKLGGTGNPDVVKGVLRSRL